MPPPWLPLAAILLVIAISAARVLTVRRLHGVQAFSFGRAPAIQSLAERNWKIAVAAGLTFAVIAWLAPDWERALGRPAWAETSALKPIAAILFAASALVIFAAQAQMGASWRIGVPAEGPGALVTHGLFAWSRNPIFAGLLGTLSALFLWSPHIGTAALLAATWSLTLVQVRLEEEALREKHGDGYEFYAARVGRWFGRKGRTMTNPSYSTHDLTGDA